MSFPLVADNDTGLLPERWHPAACSTPNLYSHITGVFAALVFGCFVFFGGWGWVAMACFCHNKEDRNEAERRLENDLEFEIFSWTNPSFILLVEIDFALCILI